MKNAQEKIKMAATFDEQESELIRAAAKIALPCHDDMDEKRKRGDYRRIIKLALYAFCRGVINDGMLVPMPVVADLRPETAEEYTARTGQAPGGFLRDHYLTEQEKRYCKLEDINPDDYLKAKYEK